MAFCRLVFPILVLSVVSCYAKLQVPVFLWGDLETSTESNPLFSVPEKEFKKILSNQISSNQNDQFTVIFVEKSLSVEDFSSKNDTGETSFPYLRDNIEQALYLPAVEQPLSVLNTFFNSQEVDLVEFTKELLSAEFERKSVKFLFITLNDAREGESRGDLLLRHNDIMKSMYTKLEKKYDQVLGIYTANFPSWVIPEKHSRVRRQAAPVSLNDYTLNGLKLFVEHLVLSVNNERANLTEIASQSSSINSTDMQTILNFGDQGTLTLNFTQSRGYWYFSDVVLERSAPTPVRERLYPKEEVYSIIGFSYRCGQNVTFSSVNDTQTYSVYFQNLKVQPYFSETNGTLEFGESLNCVGFFSVPIWSGLFVTFILLSITFYGIMMMMDIRTMDRFDDPKGKTITINANE